MMKALIRRYPDTPSKKGQDEIYLEPWLPWISENGEPLTEEGFGYAYCEDCPADASLEDFEITEQDGRYVARYVGELA